MAKKPKKSCGNCIQCEKYNADGTEAKQWTCENYDRGVGMPFDVTPPRDNACSNWSDKPEDKNRPENEMREFIDHFWDDWDDWDD